MHKTARTPTQKRADENIIPIPAPHLSTIRTLMMTIQVQQKVLESYIKEELGVDVVNENWEVDLDTGTLIHGT